MYTPKNNVPIIQFGSMIQPAQVVEGTQADTEIGQSIIDEATRRGVTIWQSKAIWNGDENKLSFQYPRMVYDASGKVAKGEKVPMDILRAAVEGNLTPPSPQPLLNPATPNFDLDPEELQ